jgi:hypothetical protein
MSSPTAAAYRRWVVERTHSWFNRFRKLLIRWEKRLQNYLALVQFAAMLIVWRLVGYLLAYAAVADFRSRRTHR